MADFAAEIEALNDHFFEFYYVFQHDWLERGQINIQAVRSLWDILNNVRDNLDMADVVLVELEPALQEVEAMNGIVHELQEHLQAGEVGWIFTGTHESYQGFGQRLIDLLYTLETNVHLARKALVEL